MYTIKPTIGLVPQDGIVPVSRNFDSAGPMTKTAHDLALLLDVVSDKDDATSFTHSLTKSWEDISVAVLDPEKWRCPDSFVKPVPAATEQIVGCSSGPHTCLSYGTQLTCSTSYAILEAHMLLSSQKPESSWRMSRL